MIEDEWGKYNPDAGNTEPRTEEELGYQPCNAVLKFTYSRYGEKRYCMGMAVGNFKNPNYEYDEYCKHHQNRAALEEADHGAQENYRHGAYIRSYEDLYRYLPPHKQMLAIDLYKSLLEESVFHNEWEPQTVTRSIETTDTFGKGSVVYTDFPLPTEHKARGTALWFASLDFIKTMNINEEQFRVAYEELGPQGEQMTVGEDKFERETEGGDMVEVKDEHHLNLPLSRIQKDYKEHLRMGGVSLDAADRDTFQVGGNRDWVFEVEAPTDAEQTASPET